MNTTRASFGRVPQTDSEVLAALERGDELLTSILRGMYQTKRAQGKEILEAYLETLEAHASAGKRHLPPSAEEG